MSPKRILVTGGTGTLGRFVVKDLANHGYQVIATSRCPSGVTRLEGAHDVAAMDLDPGFDFPSLMRGMDGVVHAALAHLPGRYRGGEGDDPVQFWRGNLLGSLALFQAAAQSRVSRIVFISTRAVYGRQPPGQRLSEATPAFPDTHYGAMKLSCEHGLRAVLYEQPGQHAAILRMTGIYGRPPGSRGHKWEDLFEDYLSGKTITPRAGTELHGSDAAGAVRLMLEAPSEAIEDPIFNVTDVMADRRAICAALQSASGSAHPLPEAADGNRFNPMDGTRIEAMGWSPGGMDLLQRTVRDLYAR